MGLHAQGAVTVTVTAVGVAAPAAAVGVGAIIQTMSVICGEAAELAAEDAEEAAGVAMTPYGVGCKPAAALTAVLDKAMANESDAVVAGRDLVKPTTAVTVLVCTGTMKV